MYIYENISIEDEFEQHKIETFSVLPMKQKYSPQRIQWELWQTRTTDSGGRLHYARTLSLIIQVRLEAFLLHNGR